jgi:hypothetical protein
MSIPDTILGMIAGLAIWTGLVIGGLAIVVTVWRMVGGGGGR